MSSGWLSLAWAQADEVPAESTVAQASATTVQ
jgi:hypothetical protein